MEYDNCRYGKICLDYGSCGGCGGFPIIQLRRQLYPLDNIGLKELRKIRHYACDVKGMCDDIINNINEFLGDKNESNN